MQKHTGARSSVQVSSDPLVQVLQTQVAAAALYRCQLHPFSYWQQRTKSTQVPAALCR
jgi:hypothetical protein